MSTRLTLLASVLTAAALAAPVAATAAEPDLLSRWALDGVSAGATPNAADPRLDGTSVTGTVVAGRFGNGLLLSGVDAPQGLLTPDPGKLVEPRSVTAMAWVKAAAAPTAYAPLIAKSAAGHEDGGRFECEASAFALMTGNGEGPFFSVVTPDGSGGADGTLTMTDAIPPASVWDGRWHAVAGVFDAQARTLSLAVDGKVVSTKAADGTSIGYDLFPQRGLSVGRLPATSCDGSGYDGAVDDVRIYGRALSPAELEYLANPAATTPPALPIGGAPAPTATPSPTVTPTAAPVPTPTAVPPALPNPVSAASVGAIAVGQKAKAPKTPPAPLRKALEGAAEKIATSLTAPKPKSTVTTSSPKLSKQELAKVKPSRSLADVLDELEFGLPVTVKAPAGARYVQIGAAITIRRKTPTGKLEESTIVLPPAVFPVVKGVASGRLTIDPTAAKVLRKSGAVDAAVGIVSVVASNLPKATAAEQAAIDQMLAKQAQITGLLTKQIKLLDGAQKTLQKAEQATEQAKTKASEQQAAAKEATAKDREQDARDAAQETVEELSKQRQEALDAMVKQIIDFVRQLQDAKALQLQAMRI
ncbi:MAG: hypothetical protein PGN13_05625 [Patulibacter minatonensis]